MSAAAICAIVAGITVLSDEAHDLVTGVFGGTAVNELSLAGGRTLHFASLMATTLGTYAADYQSLAIFGVGSLVLLGLMLRA